ncbi:MAG TPA: hypothetical protein VF622_09310, partial [Segetibacter sp.]
LLSAFILIVFAYSITPKLVLHNLVANHTDKKKVLNLNTTELSATGLNCKCDNLVAESPFVPEEVHINNVITSFFTFPAIPESRFYSSSGLFSELRGPPVN